MRGTPFDAKNWVGGLNSIDSPYTLEENESRDLLNVVSTERGSIRKRYGSTVFASGTQAFFPSLSVTDSFKRAAENPLSNAGNWIKMRLAAETGEVKENTLRGTHVFGAYWNTKQKNPCTSIERAAFSAPTFFALWSCMDAESTNGYRAIFEKETTGYKLTLGVMKAGIESKKLTVKTVLFEVGDALGMAVRGGIVAIWRNHEGTWSKVGELADTSFTEGFSGFESFAGSYNNFTLGEVPAALAELELTTIVPVTVTAGAFLIAAAGKNLYAVSTAGVITIIGEGFTEGARWSVVQAPISIGVAAQGPVYLVNGIDKPQYWTGATAGTKVKEWTGVSAQPKLTDGAIATAGHSLKSETAAFTSTDVGLMVKFESTVKAEVESKELTITEAEIVTVVNAKEVELSLGGGEAVWKETLTGVHFTLERGFYKEGKNVPNGQYMVFVGNRIWMTGIKQDPSAVWFSETAPIGEGGEQADPSSWPATNVVRFDGSDGQAITSIGVTGPYLLVFKPRKTWVVHNLNSGENRKLADTIGCVAPRSVVETSSGTFFLTADQGVYVTDGSKLVEMSYKVRPTILNINPAQRQNAAGVYFNNHYYLSFAYSTSAVNNRTLDYDAQLKAWWLHDLAGNQWTSWESVAGEPALFTLPPRIKGGVVKAFVPGVYTDSGANYAGNGILGAWWISRWDPFAYYVFRHRIEAPFLKKRLRQIFFNGSGEIIPLVYRNFTEGGEQVPAVVGNESQAEPTLPVNFSQSETVFGNENEEQVFGGSTYGGVTQIFGGSRQTGTARAYALGVADVWSVGWGNNSNAGFEIDAYTLNVSFRKS